MITIWKKIKRSLLRMKSENAGNATVEFVVTFPLLVVAFIFVFEFSQIFWTHQIATYNLRSAVRFLSRTPLTSDDLTKAENLAKTGSATSSTGSYGWMEDVVITTTPSFATFTDDDFRVNGQIIKMRAQVPISVSLFGLLNVLSGSGIRTGVNLTIVEEARYIGD